MDDNDLNKQQRENIEKIESDNDNVSLKTQIITEYIVALCFFLLSGFMLIVAYNTKFYHPMSRTGLSPMALPKVFLGILFLCSIIQLFKTSILMYRNKEKVKTDKLVMFEGKIPIIFIVFFVYAVLWRILGVSLCTPLVFGFCVKYTDPERRWKEVILFSLLFTVFIIIFFKIIFHIPFYDPLLEKIVIFIHRRIY